MLLKKAKPYLILLGIVLMAYLPLSTFHFGMKNDAFSDNFGNKYFLSEALHSGMLPLWNPYLNFGFPVYADMGFAFWNPITWLFAIAGYNAYTLTLEVLCYIYLSGIAMYRLGRYFKFSFYTALSVACMYMCSGFFVGHLQHINFLSAAAFIPFMLKYFLKIIYTPSYKNSFWFSISVFMIAVAGHPAIPFGLVYFLVILLALIFIFDKSLQKNYRKPVIYFAFSALKSILFLAPLIYSYLKIFPEYKRYAIINPDSDLHGSFDFASMCSFIYPYSTAGHSSIFFSDISGRDIYFSIAGFVFLFFGFKGNKKIALPLFLAGAAMLFFSLYEPLRHILFDRLPLFNYVRTNAEYRVFCILCFCSIAGFGMMNLNLQNARSIIFIKKFFKIFLISNITLLACISFLKHSDISFFFQNIFLQNSVSGEIKYFLSGLSFSEGLSVSVLINIFISLFFILLKKYSARRIFAVIALDLIINTILYLPVTGIGQTTLKEIQTVYDNNPKGIPIPPFTPINKIDTFNEVATGLVGSSSYYNKKIGITRLTNYPTYFTHAKNYFTSTAKDTVAAMPYLFLKSNLGKLSVDSNIVVERFSPTNISIKVKAENANTLVYLQNNYQGWSATVNGNDTKIETAFSTFISVPVSKGTNEVELNYRDKYLIYFLILSLFSFAVCVFIYFRKRALK